MPRVLLAHGDDCHSVGATLGWQVKVDDFRELFLQDRHEDFVQRQAENGGLVRRPAGIGAVVNRVFAVRDGFHGEYREALDFIVVARVIAEGALIGHFARLQITFQDDLGAGRNLQPVIAATCGIALGEFSFGAAQQSGEGVLGQAVGHRGNGTQRRGGVCPQGDGNRIALAGVLQLPVAIVQGAAPM